MFSRTFLMMAAGLMMIVSSSAFGDDKQAPESTRVDTATVQRAGLPDTSAPANLQQPSGNYDAFVDENENGIDDKYEEAKRLKVKVQGIQERSKPNRDKKP